MTNEINAEPTSFAKLGITGTLLKATVAAGFDMPKPVQEKAIPPFLAGSDVLGVAQTGSGKTAAFALPILTRIVALGSKRLPKTARALILAPTRELAVQIEDTVKILSKGLHISTALVLGGVSRGSQVKKIAPGVDVLVATPGRLTDLVRERDLVDDVSRLIVGHLALCDDCLRPARRAARRSLADVDRRVVGKLHLRLGPFAGRVERVNDVERPSLGGRRYRDAALGLAGRLQNERPLVRLDRERPQK